MKIHTVREKENTDSKREDRVIERTEKNGIGMT